jgi:hypothetical protein
MELTCSVLYKKFKKADAPHCETYTYITQTLHETYHKFSPN